MQYIFWTGLAILVYTYLGYGVLLWAVVSLKRIFQRPKHVNGNNWEYPEVTHLIAAYNEAEMIEAKVKNSLNMNYPGGKMQVLFVTDGSDDDTPDILKKMEGITLMHRPERKGKIAAVKRAMEMVHTPICVFSDANTLLNPEAIQRIVRHFSDPDVGAVAGEKRIYMPEQSAANAAGEGIYWRYESFLKRLDAELNSVVGAAGELFAIRTDLFPQIPADTIIEDFYLTVSIAMQVYKVEYEPEAYAMETGSASVEEEFKRKVRICAGGFQAISRLSALFNPVKYGWLTFQFVSHRVLRWTLAPLSLLIVLLSNIFLAIETGNMYIPLLVCQLGFYALAAIGYIRRNHKIRKKMFFIPFYFIMMNLSAFLGFRRFLKKSQSVLWERAQREKSIDSVGA